MAYHRNWRKRHAEVLSLAADDSNSSDTDGLQRAQFSEDETASLAPSADGNISDYNSDASVVSSDTDSEVADNRCDHSAEESAPDLGEEIAAWATTNKCKRSANKDYVFVKEVHEEGTLVCDVLRRCNTESFFTDPCDSKLLNIVRARDISRTTRRLISKQQLIRKVVCLPANPGLMMWVRAVWKEPNGEEEGVIPEVWVKDNMVHWPPGANVTKAAKEMRMPASSWKMFPLLKIKFKSNEDESTPDGSRSEDLSSPKPKPPRVPKMSSQASGSEENMSKSRSRSPLHDSHFLLQSSRSPRQRSQTQHHSTSHHRSQSPTHSTPRQEFHTPRQRSHTPRQRSQLHASAPKLQASAPTLHASAPTLHASAPTLHASAPTLHATVLHATVPNLRPTALHTSGTILHTIVLHATIPNLRPTAPHASSPALQTTALYASGPTLPTTDPPLCSTALNISPPALLMSFPTVQVGGTSTERTESYSHWIMERVLYLLSDIRAKLSEVGQNREPPESQFHLEKMNSRRELKNLEGQLADDEKRNVMVSRLIRIGGANLEDCVKNVMKSSPPGQADSAKQYANGGEEPKTPIEKKNLGRTQAQPGDSSSPLAKAAASAQAQQCLHNKA
ncbi:hypothetical protein E1301_Tti017778 [Triplophysa tibetana]|uniref:Uncharacterized protein n=1 Tax=Triplophysa tibetana TaxID=1572043 RepID=A0A5A9N839_9TELE|nr:hypothetical protein E1301_Tti017778 [Triplophysa tibetana]